MISDLISDAAVQDRALRRLFSYIEVIYKDGNRHYFYENQTGFDRFEKDFYDKRFTSFHEFWTTEEAAEENRDLFSFRYYVRRPEDAYTHLTTSEMDELKTKLPASCKPDRIYNFITKGIACSPTITKTQAKLEA